MLTLYSKETTSFSTLGIGVLRDFISHPLITEELNGAYTLEFEYAKDGYLSEYLIEQNIIKANGQAFRIWNIKKDMQKITVLAKHIFFDLSFNFLADVFPTNLTAQSALAWMLNRAAVATNFSATGNCTQTSSTRYVRKNFIDAVFNEDNALLKKFGGELSYDNFNITVHEHRGTNANFSIRYKKNLTGIDFNLDFSNVATRIVPIGFDGLTIDSTYVESPRASNYFTPLYKTYEFNDIKYDPDDEEAYHTLAEAKQALINAANELFTKNVDLPQVSIGVNFVELSKCSEYASYSNLETVYLGDTIDVIIPELNIHTSARVNKTVYDCILERFITLEIGSAKQSITRSQIVIENQIRKSENYLTQAQQNAENLINHPFNGNVLIDKENGVIYLMDSTSPATAQNVWKWSLGGLGFSSTGINGTYTVAILQDGRINADFITTGQLNTGVIQGYDSLLIQVDTLDREFQKEINPTDIASGSSISLDDSAETELIDFSLEGDTTQETRSGKNLYDYTQTYSAPTHSTVDDEGWITATYDNTNGSSTAYCNYYSKIPNNVILDTNATYTVFLEVKSVSYGKNSDYITISNNNANFIPKSSLSSAQLHTLSNNTVYRYGLTTKDDLTGVTGLLRTFVAVASGSNVTLVYRLSLLKGSISLDDFVYEPYGVMPSPEFPSELVSVGYENFFDGSNINYTYNGITWHHNDDSSITISGKATATSTRGSTYDLNIPKGQYTISINHTLPFDLKFRMSNGVNTVYATLPKNSLSFLYNLQYDMTIMRVYIDTDIAIDDEINETIFIQFVEGVEKNYIPYGKYGIEIKKTGKNLFDGIFRQGARNNTTATNRIYSLNNFKIEQGKTYTISTNLDTSIFRYAANISQQLYPNSIAMDYDSGWKITSSFTFTASTTGYFGIPISRIDGANLTPSDITGVWFMLEENGQPTTYEPYTSHTNSIVLDEPLRSIGNIKDLLYIKNGILYVERYIGTQIISNGSFYNGSTYKGYYLTLQGKKYINNNGLICDRAKYVTTVAERKNGSVYENAANVVFVGSTTDTLATVKEKYDGSEIQYILAEPTIEELGETDIPSTYEGITHIFTTDELEPNMNITYVRDTAIGNYVEGQVNGTKTIEERHYSEIKLTEEGITSRVETTEIATDELSGRMNAVEIEQTSQQATINILGTNIDLTNGEVREVTTTTGFTFNAEGMTISDSDSNFRALHRKDGTYYYDGENVVGQYTKDGSKQKDLELFGVYTYGKASINSPSMFIAQLYTDSNGEVGMGHFYNGGE